MGKYCIATSLPATSRRASSWSRPDSMRTITGAKFISTCTETVTGLCRGGKRLFKLKITLFINLITRNYLPCNVGRDNSMHVSSKSPSLVRLVFEAAQVSWSWRNDRSTLRRTSSLRTVPFGITLKVLSTTRPPRLHVNFGGGRPAKQISSLLVDRVVG